jgi:putative oxidoreductase
MFTTTSTVPLDVATVSGGLLIARLVLGLAMAAHGTQKLFGWFGGYGLAGTGGYFEGLGFRPGRLFAAAAALGEITGGLLVTLGLFGPIGPALMISTMLVAIATVHWSNGFFASGNGVELPFLYAAGALALAFTGFGGFSLDALAGLAGLYSPGFVTLAVIAGVLGGLGTLALRQPAGKPVEAHS